MSLVVGASACGEPSLWHRRDLPDGPRSIFEIGSPHHFAGFAPEAGVSVVVLSNAARAVGRLGLKLLAALIRECVLARAAPGR